MNKNSGSIESQFHFFYIFFFIYFLYILFIYSFAMIYQSKSFKIIKDQFRNEKKIIYSHNTIMQV